MAEGVGELEEGVYLSVNLSPRTLESELFHPSDVTTIFGRRGISPKQIVIELTEREEVQDLEGLRRNAAACRRAGFRLAADDVGAGNAGLRLLSEIQFDIVKIDLSLVQGGVLHDPSFAVLRALQELAARWHATIVAEGVETSDQLAAIRSINIMAGQGYLLGRPRRQRGVEADRHRGPPARRTRKSETYRPPERGAPDARPIENCAAGPRRRRRARAPERAHPKVRERGAQGATRARASPAARPQHVALPGTLASTKRRRPASLRIAMTAPSVTTPPEIQLLDLEKRFREVRAVDGVSLEVGAGEFFSLLGPSGCGKTTTLRMIGGFELPTGGTILLRGRDVTADPPDKRPVNMVFQNYALFPHLDVGDNVAFGLKRKGVAKDETARRVGEALELVHLTGYERRKPNQLSGGQQQRVALARALVNRPNVLLLDEPLGALDLKLRRQLQVELKRIQSEVGITFVYVTHDQEEALTMSDRIAVMHAGKVEQLGTPEELYERPATRFVADFIGSTNLLRGRIEADGRVRLDLG